MNERDRLMPIVMVHKPLATFDVFKSKVRGIGKIDTTSLQQTEVHVSDVSL